MFLTSLILVQDHLKLRNLFKGSPIRHQMQGNAKLRKQQMQSSDLF